MKANIIYLLRKTWQSYHACHTPRLGAALAYYTFLSFFPLLLIFIALMGLALRLNLTPALSAQAYVLAFVAVNLPAAQSLVFENIVDITTNSTRLGLVGLVAVLWTASSIFAAMDESFDVIFEVSRRRTWRSTARSRSRAVLVVILLGVLLVTSLVVSTVIGPAEIWLEAFPGGGSFIYGANLVASLGASALIFTAVYRLFPRRPVSWKAAFGGSIFTALTWQLGRDTLSWWLSRINTATMGNVIGSVLAFLILVYFAWQIILLGAELAEAFDDLEEDRKVKRGDQKAQHP